MMKRIITLGILIILLAVCSPVWAGLTLGESVYVDFKGVNPSSYVRIQVGTNEFRTQAGSYNIEIKGQLFKTFCIDLWQYSRDGTFIVTPLADAPKTGGAGYVLGFNGAADITKLISYNYDNLGTSSYKWAGMQVAVWEVVGDHDTTGYDLYSGTFQLKYANDSVRNYALQYLASISQGSGQLKRYAAVTNRCKQDYLVPLVPAPGAIMLGALGMGLIGWMRRYRTL